ncbi:hypothetical protein ACO0M4_25695 [Streptomyces sp. RGM 3693]|uniref:hypothetical protein n=1 Tax=Streptomyces sp. RGM 3693 TaxID=3413284 RepID=UPI003D285BF0
MSQESPTPPASPAEALAIFRSRFAQPKLADGSPVPLHVHEFDIGYLVYRTYPTPTDAAGRPMPPPPGGAKVIVAKDTGETYTVPNLPTESAIALYRQQREPGA